MERGGNEEMMACHVLAAGARDDAAIVGKENAGIVLVKIEKTKEK